MMLLTKALVLSQLILDLKLETSNQFHATHPHPNAQFHFFLSISHTMTGCVGSGMAERASAQPHMIP